MATALKEDDDKIKEPDLIIVEDDPNAAPANAEVKTGNAEIIDDDDDERVAQHNEEDETVGKSDKQVAEIRERRRLEKVERKERKDRAMARDKIERDFLLKRNDDLERRLTEQERRTLQLDIGNLDAQIAAANHEVAMADQVMSKAIAAGNGEDATKALGFRDAAKDRAMQLTFAKQQAQRQPAQQSSGVDDAAMVHAKKFMSENAWYNPKGANEESAIVLAIDGSLAREGYDPRSEEYWDELRDRAAKRLPEKFAAVKDDGKADERRPRGGPTVGSGREHVSANTRANEVYISPERKQALKDAGVWDDPLLRMKYVKRYAAYDKEHKA